MFFFSLLLLLACLLQTCFTPNLQNLAPLLPSFNPLLLAWWLSFSSLFFLKQFSVLHSSSFCFRTELLTHTHTHTHTNTHAHTHAIFLPCSFKHSRSCIHQTHNTPLTLAVGELGWFIHYFSLISRFLLH